METLQDRRGAQRVQVLFAPDKFAGTLTAQEAAEAMAEGWARTRPDDRIVVRPMADGGEGTVSVVAASQPSSRLRQVEVADARGTAVLAGWLQLDPTTALVEAAAACGLSQLAPHDRDPLRLTSYGVGQLVQSAADAGAEHIIVGLGGSATVDGGAGAATALGHRLLRADGNGLKVGGRYLTDLDRVVPGPVVGADVVVAVDVANPLLGPDGAARVFGPQKGADESAVAHLEAGLARWADIVERDLDGGPWRDLEGAGAAGGLGFGLAAFAGGRLTSGAAVVAGLIGLDEAIGEADIVVTGEGALDAQTSAGKAPEHVRRQAAGAGRPTAVIAGRVEAGASRSYDHARALGPDGVRRARESVVAAAADLAADVDVPR